MRLRLEVPADQVLKDVSGQTEVLYDISAASLIKERAKNRLFVCQVSLGIKNVFYTFLETLLGAEVLRDQCLGFGLFEVSGAVEHRD